MGERLGRYRVIKHLASGGMADVLVGRTDGIEGFERHVVLKRIKTEHAKDKRFISMFLDEARVAANLHHQNIVQVYDIGEDSGEYFFAMEYLHGEDLRKLLSAVSKARTHMPLGYVCAILSAAAAGLHYAHERRDAKQKPLNIVHRDVSPSNILIGYDGGVKVVDFGIAKAAMRNVETHSGSLKGKVSYMSPEQCRGDDVDRRSDVYALGVLLYELATTTRLFKGDNDYLMMDAIVNGKVPLPRVRRPDLPNELSSIIMRAVSVDKQRRYQTADELRIALDAFAVKHNLTASTSALAGYMRKMFGGERPEPWLDVADETPNIDVDAPTQAAHHSWSEIGRDAFAEDATQDQLDKRTTESKRGMRRSAVSDAAAVADTIAPPISTRETRTSMKMGWEARGHAPLSNRSKALWIGVPLLIIIGLSLRLALHSDAPSQKAAATRAAPATVAQPAPPPAPAPIAAPVPAREIPTVRVAGSEVPSPVSEPPPVETTVAPAVTKKAGPGGDRGHTAVPAKKAPPAKTEKVAPKPEPAPALAPAPIVTATPTPAPAPAPVVVTPPPAPPPEKEVEAPPATLSNALVSAIASEHSSQISQCEGSSDLHGDVAVSFQIDGAGKVIKSQLSSSIKNAKVAGCILKAVQSWKFPKPPSGSAKGVYSISYQ